jgi:hypothetical protein
MYLRELQTVGVAEAIARAQPGIEPFPAGEKKMRNKLTMHAMNLITDSETVLDTCNENSVFAGNSRN